MPLLELSRMDSPPKLTGETLIVHHIPLVHCQVPDRQCCGGASGGGGSSRPNPFCPPELGLPQAGQDLGQADSLLYGSLHSAPGAPTTRSSDGIKSRSRDGRGPGAPKRHNPFLVQESVGETGLGDLYEDSAGDSATQQSFHLHTASQPTFHLSSFQLPPSGPGLGRPWGATTTTRSRPGVVEGQEREPATALGSQQGSASHGRRPELDAETMDLDECGGPGGSGGGAFSFDQEWRLSADESPRHPGHSGSGAGHYPCSSTSSQSEAADQSMGYVSDSSCNSSDGVLVTFSTLYKKTPGSSRANLNSVPQSCSDSSFCSHSDPGAFYLDLQPSPAESKMSCESHHPENGDREEGCGCPHASSPELDANCNSYRPHCEPCPAVADLTACFQSQARLVVATQNYYKLVTCDLSSQSSPSPAGSSITSCSEEQTKISPPPGPGSDPDLDPSQPSEYYLFQKPDIQPEEQETVDSSAEAATAEGPTVLEGQVYTNTSPPNPSAGRQRSRSYDRSLERSPPVRLGSLERMLSCPVRLSEGPAALAGPASPPRRVTSFAELAKGRRRATTGSGSPPLRVSTGDSSQEFSPIQEAQQDRAGPLDEGAPCSHSLPSMPLGPSLDLLGPEPWSTQLCQGSQSSEMPLPSLRAAGQGPLAPLMDPGSPANSHTQRDARARADGGGPESRPVLRYSKEQRPTTLPIQPFMFQHHFPKQLAKARALHSLSQLYSLSGCSRAQQPAPLVISTAQGPAPAPAPSGEPQTFTPQTTGRGARKAGPEPETSRPSPLGSYSPVRSAGPFGPSTDSSTCTSCSPPPEQATAAESLPPWSHTCPPTVQPAASQQPLKEDQKIPTLAEYRLHGTGSLPPLGSWRSGFPRAESLARGGGEGSMASRPNNANHLSPQALKWREYRRKNPLGPPGLSGSLDRRPQEVRLARRNPIFEFPGSLGTASHLNYRLNGQIAKPLPVTCPDLQDPFPLTEKPPAEFCLSPDGNSEAISIDVLQKKGLVKAVNTAVDLIVAHFGTSRDPGVKAKLGNSSVSPNVGHLVLKYLCPAVQAVLEDGLKAFVLDVIIGQRKNMPWSVVEASTQLGPSTKVLHGLYNKVSQFPELTSHTMRFNAFILGLLNIRSLEFWFNHLYNHEDIIQTHYQPWGFLRAAHTVCPGLFEELLLLLQPLALLPFSLDLLFQHRLLQSGQQQRHHKELLRVSQDLLLSAHSTLQLARARGQEGPGDTDRVAPGERVKGVGASEGGEEEEEEDTEEAAVVGGSSEHGRWTRGGQAGWWYQLMQSSQVYIEGATEGSRFPRSSAGSEKKKGGGSGGPSQAPPPREGVVEGAEACPAPEEALGQERGWPFWMGSPPDSVLAELRRSREREGPVAPPTENEEGTAESSPGGIKWGHLFGSRKAPRDARPANRLPSDWLSLDRSVFQLVAQTMGARREPEPRENLQDSHLTALPSKPPCEVQALCHHLATGPGQLSFHKGDILRVLGAAGGDWLRCSRGPDTGLVPLAYVTLTPTPSSPTGSSQN